MEDVSSWNPTILEAKVLRVSDLLLKTKPSALNFMHAYTNTYDPFYMFHRK